MTREGGEKSQNCMAGGSFAQPKEMPCDMVPVLNCFLLKQLQKGIEKSTKLKKRTSQKQRISLCMPYEAMCINTILKDYQDATV